MPRAPHKEFAERLHRAWDWVGVPTGDRRTGAVSERYKVSREAARKWSLGMAIPRDERLRTMAVQMNVSYEWLSTGRGDMEGHGLDVRETPNKYDSPEVVRLTGLVRNLTREKQLALIVLLESER